MLRSTDDQDGDGGLANPAFVTDDHIPNSNGITTTDNSFNEIALADGSIEQGRTVIRPASPKSPTTAFAVEDGGKSEGCSLFGFIALPCFSFFLTPLWLLVFLCWGSTVQVHSESLIFQERQKDAEMDFFLDFYDNLQMPYIVCFTVCCVLY